MGMKRKMWSSLTKYNNTLTYIIQKMSMKESNTPPCILRETFIICTRGRRSQLIHMIGIYSRMIYQNSLDFNKKVMWRNSCINKKNILGLSKEKLIICEQTKATHAKWIKNS